MMLDKKDKITRRVLLENFLDDRMLSRIKSDISVDEDTPIRGANGLLVKLESYYFDDQPMIIHRHNFTSCKQDRGEKFVTWWEQKLQRGQECSLDTMKSKDWLQQELFRGVSDPTLQKRLLQERDPKLEDLVKIATLWQGAGQALQSFGTEVSEYVQQGVHEPSLQPVAEDDGGTPDEHIIWTLSEYKREGKSNWRNQQRGKTQLPPPRQN